MPTPFSGEPKATATGLPRGNLTAHAPLALLCAAIPLFLANASPGATGEQNTDWPQFLGPTRNAVSAEKGLNWDWKGSPPKVLWKAPMGNGFSSLTIVGDRLFTQAKRGERDMVICLDVKDGRELWAFDAAPSYLDLQRQGA